MNGDTRTGPPRLPVAAWLPRYSRARLPGDLRAGAVVTALAVPQALGYAGIAGVPVQVGLYAIPLALPTVIPAGATANLLMAGTVSEVTVASGLSARKGGRPASISYSTAPSP